MKGWHVLEKVAGATMMGAIALTVAACGDGDDPVTGVASDAEGHVHIETKGRLAILETGVASVRILDLDDNTVVGSIATANPPSALYASPDRRYAVAIQRSQDRVEFIDGGVWQEDHGDHLHDYEAPPALVAKSLEGVRPTHFEVHDGIAALFTDGLVDNATPAGVITFTDADIGAGKVTARMTLALPMHGTAEPRGDSLLTTFREAGGTDTLPVQVERYRRTGESFELVERFEPRCPSLHGSYSNAGHTVFGCADGVLVIAQQGDTFTASKIANPAGFAADLRIGTVLGHHDLPLFVGIAGTQTVVAIDPQGGAITPIDWAPGRTRVAHAIDAHGENLLLLDEQGSLHVLDAKNGWALRAILPVTGPTATGASASNEAVPSIDASHGSDTVYVADPAGQRVVEIDLATATLAREIPLGFKPGAVRWLGIAGEHDHE